MRLTRLLPIQLAIGILFTIFTIYNIYPQNVSTFDIQGTLLNGEEPISFASVVIKELDIIEFSNEEGVFSIPNIQEGSYTLIIIADGFEEKEFPLVVNAEFTPQIYQLGDEVASEVFQDEIIVRADRFEDSTSSQEVYSKVEVELLPLVNDNPISIVTNEAGTIFNNNSVGGENNSLAGQVGGGKLYSLAREYSLYGGDNFWNRYFLGNIQIPTNTHPANGLTSIITRRAISTVTSFRGLPKGIYGQGIGGTVALTPKINNEKNILIDISSSAPSVTLNYPIRNDIYFFTNARYSIDEFTTVPLTNLIIEQLDVPGVLKLNKLRYGDLLIGLEYTPPNHMLQLLLLGFFDVNDLDVDVEQGNDEFEIVPINKPLFGAVGVTWDYLIDPIGSNTLSTYYTAYYSSTDFLIDIKNNDGEITYAYNGATLTHDYTILDTFDWYLNDTSVLSFGLQLKIIILSGIHSEKYSRSVPDLNISIPLTRENTSIEQDLYRLYAYTEYAWAATDNIETSFILGVSQLLHQGSEYKTFPSALSSVDINFAKKWKFSLSASISPSFLEGSRMADKLISEKVANYSNTSSYSRPTYGFTTIPKLTWQANDNHALYLEPFFAYYFNFSGFHSNMTVNNDSTQPRGYSYITPEQGFSAGGALTWKWNKDNIHFINSSYTLGFALYDTSYGWIPPDNDYRHLLKFSYIFNKDDKWKLSISSFLYYDIPFTSYTLTENLATQNVADTYEKIDTPFSARSYIPQYGLTANFKRVIKQGKNWKLIFEFQPGDLIAWIVVNDRKLVSGAPIGTSTKHVQNRKIDVSYNIGNLFLGFFVALNVEIKLP